MQLILENNSSVDIELLPSPVSHLIERWFRHLRHVDLPFRPWEYTGYVSARQIEDIVGDLASYGKVLSIQVNKDRALDQDFLNELHRIYEENYDGRQAWTDYHEHIHILENKLLGKPLEYKLEMNYRHLSGPLNRPFQIEWLSHGQTQLKAGDVYLAWDELGKTPYTYWRDAEPDDIKRICQLAKPWLTIRPKIHVCLRDIDLHPEENVQFQRWWSGFEQAWCQHYGIPTWSHRDSNTVLVIGKIQKYQDLEGLLEQKIWPYRITL